MGASPLIPIPTPTLTGLSGLKQQWTLAPSSTAGTARVSHDLQPHSPMDNPYRSCKLTRSTGAGAVAWVPELQEGVAPPAPAPIVSWGW